METSASLLPAAKLQPKIPLPKFPCGRQRRRQIVQSPGGLSRSSATFFCQDALLEESPLRKVSVSEAGDRCVLLRENDLLCPPRVPACALPCIFRTARKLVGARAIQPSHVGVKQHRERVATDMTCRFFRTLVEPPGYFRRSERRPNPDAGIPFTLHTWRKTGVIPKPTPGMDPKDEIKKNASVLSGQRFVASTQDRQITRKRLEGASAAASLVRELLLRHRSDRRPPSMLSSYSDELDSFCRPRSKMYFDSSGESRPARGDPPHVETRLLPDCSSSSSPLPSFIVSSSSAISCTCPFTSPSVSSPASDSPSPDMLTPSLKPAGSPSCPKVAAETSHSTAPRTWNPRTERRFCGHQGSTGAAATAVSLDSKSESVDVMGEAHMTGSFLEGRRCCVGRNSLVCNETAISPVLETALLQARGGGVCEVYPSKEGVLAATPWAKDKLLSSSDTVEFSSEAVTRTYRKKVSRKLCSIDDSIGAVSREKDQPIYSRTFFLDRTSSAVAVAVENGDFRLLNVMLTEALTRAVSPQELFRLVWRFRKFLIPANVATALHALVKMTRKPAKRHACHERSLQPVDARKVWVAGGGTLIHSCVQLLFWHLVPYGELTRKKDWMREDERVETEKATNTGTDRVRCLSHRHLDGYEERMTATALDGCGRVAAFERQCSLDTRSDAEEHPCGSTKLEKLSARHLPVALWSIAKLLHVCNDRLTGSPYISNRGDRARGTTEKTSEDAAVPGGSLPHDLTAVPSRAGCVSDELPGDTGDACSLFRCNVAQEQAGGEKLGSPDRRGFRLTSSEVRSLMTGATQALPRAFAEQRCLLGEQVSSPTGNAGAWKVQTERQPERSDHPGDSLVAAPCPRFPKRKDNRMRWRWSTPAVDAAWICSFLKAATRAVETRAAGFTLQGINMTAWALAAVHVKVATNAVCLSRLQCSETAAAMRSAFLAMGHRLAFLLQHSDNLTPGEHGAHAVETNHSVWLGSSGQISVAGSTGRLHAGQRSEKNVARHTGVKQPCRALVCSPGGHKRKRTPIEFADGGEDDSESREKERARPTPAGCVYDSPGRWQFHHGVHGKGCAGWERNQKSDAETECRSGHLSRHGATHDTLRYPRLPRSHAAGVRTLTSFLSACARLQPTDPTLVIPLLKIVFGSSCSNSLAVPPSSSATVGRLASLTNQRRCVLHQCNAHDLAEFASALAEFSIAHQKTHCKELDTSKGYRGFVCCEVLLPVVQKASEIIPALQVPQLLRLTRGVCRAVRTWHVEHSRQETSLGIDENQVTPLNHPPKVEPEKTALNGVPHTLGAPPRRGEHLVCAAISFLDKAAARLYELLKNANELFDGDLSSSPAQETTVQNSVRRGRVFGGTLGVLRAAYADLGMSTPSSLGESVSWAAAGSVEGMRVTHEHR